MKKQTLLAVAFALLLASCNVSGGGSTSSTDTSPSSTSSSSVPSGTNVFVESGWPEKEAETLASLMIDHLYPYYDFGKSGYSYELTTYEEAYAMTSAHIEIANFPFEEVRNYLSAMTDGTGYEDKSANYQVVDGYYIIEKTFSDYSFISASFSIMDEDENVLTSGNGTFELDIHPARIAKEAWLGGDIENFLADLFESEITLPNPSSPASRYITAVYSREGMATPSLSFVGIDARDSYGADLASIGWRKVPIDDSSFAGHSYYISPDEKIGVNMYLASASNPMVTAMEFEMTQYFINYPSTIVNECLDYFFSSSEHVSLPTPEPENVLYYHMNNHSQSDHFFSLYMHGVDYVKEYEALLTEASYHLVDYQVKTSQYTYADESETIIVMATYNAEQNFTDITVNKNSNFHAGWPKEIADEIIQAIGGETLLPSDNEATYSFVTDFDEGDEDFAIYTKDFDANMTPIDTTDRYAALLNASGSGWIYDEIENRWRDGKNKLSVALHFTVNNGLEILVEPYIPSEKELSESELLAAFTGIGVEGYAFVTIAGASGYSLINGTGSFSILAWRVDETLLAAYRERLTNDGYTYKRILGSDYYWDSAKKVGFTMTHDEDHDIVTISFQSYVSCFNYSGSNLSAYITQIKEQYDPAFTFPSIPCGANAEGMIRLGESYAYTVFTIVIFETGFRDDLYAALEADGWRKQSSGSSHYIKDGQNEIWSIRITEDSDYNYTTIDITGR